MLRLAGELADGVLLGLCNAAYVREVVVPEVSAGRQRTGAELEGFDIAPMVPAALTGDRSGVYAALRRELVVYFGLPFYRALIERSGFGADLERFDAAAGDAAARRDAISDAFLEERCAVGGESELRAGIERYRAAGASSPLLLPIGGTDFEATLRAGAP